MDLRIEPSERLRRAVYCNDASLVRRIVKSHPGLIHNPDHSATGLSNSSLHLAASLGHLQVCKVLVALGHELPTPALNDNHQTALMLASSAGHTEVVLFLAESDPTSILRRDIRGRDAVMEASMGGHDTVLQILLTYAPGGARSAVQNADLDGNTALHFASSNGNLLVLRTLLAAGADPEKRNVWSWTAIAYSATVQAEVYLKGLVSEVEKRRRIRNDTEEARKGGTVRMVEEEIATRLTINQHFWIHPSRHSWAWLVIGSFYDSEDHELWRITLVACDTLNVAGTLAIGEEDEDLTDDIETQSDSDNISNSSNSSDSSDSSEPQEEAFDSPTNHIYYPRHYPVVPIPLMALQSFGNGWNPQFGVDQDPGQPFGSPTPGIVCIGSSGYDYLSSQGSSALTRVTPGVNNQGPVYVIAQNGQNLPVPVFPSQGPRLPNPHPVVNPDAPALNLINSTGGFGCEPGYNYFFSGDHTKLHIIKSSTAPWRIPEGMSMSFGAYHVPVKTTLAELLVGFGALNPCPRKNKITEVIQGGSAKWYRGVTFSGDSDSMTKTLAELGWDRSRTGRPGEKPVIWLWITKD
ncbi:ankyrin repeat-containing domain protein [Daldinia sp. FL1419]|nr:ankyrin repeat-containing domain protein [Daldinia sp. FL1419]